MQRSGGLRRERSVVAPGQARSASQADADFEEFVRTRSAHLLRLALLLATISQDGHVLFSPFFGLAPQPYLARVRQ